ncbi:LysE/ArgO family amino acid transporter [Acetonema longum]|uniref:Lysine exporter protein LysE/YggA n=1 Tax=Acetonema longum DSM 6540 TaxID=1009370 RepID=F7NMR4_9FIRM|nr:LysE family transporter [Acetonema longum]EGO62656.1 lysine exporter protein LysE/YggA [Acetonema longum DSM 6540]
MLIAFFHGLLLALGLILPLGVQNVFVFTQGAVQPSYWRAMPVVLTASLADTFLILLAVLGVSVAVLQFYWLKLLLISAGFLFLLYMSWVTWKSSASSRSRQDQALWSLKRRIFFALSVSLLNPHAIIDTIGVIGVSSLAYTGLARLAFTLACILVSWVWFFGLSLAGRFTGQADSSGRLLQGLQRFSAVIIFGCAIILLAGVEKSL